MKSKGPQVTLATKLEKIVYEGLGKTPLLQQGDKVTVGFSGGADSVALLHLLAQWATLWDLRLQAAHLNHQLRGKASDRDEAFCRKFGESLNIPFFARSLDIGALSKEAGLSTEEGGRRERYRFFRELSGGGKIATGHTLSDQGETVILNLTRGSGLEGLGGIPQQRGQIIRPLLEVTRQQVEDYCSHYRLPYVTDHTNAETVYSRNKVRHKVVPVLKEINPNVEQQIKQTTGLLRQDSDYLNRQSQGAYKTILGEKGCSRQEFLRLHPALSSRVLLLLLEEASIPPSFHCIALMDKGIREQQQVQLTQDVFLLVSGDHFILANPALLPQVVEQDVTLSFQESKILEVALDKGRTLVFQCIDCKDFGNSAEYALYGLKNCLDCDKIGVMVKIRPRQQGDHFAPLGRGLHKSLKKLFIEEKIPAWARANRVVLEGQEGLLWVEGFGVHDHYKVGKNRTKILFLSIKNEFTGENHER